MKKTRFAYQIVITQLCIGICQVILVILLGMLLLIAPYIFSSNSPRQMISRDCTIIKIIPSYDQRKESNLVSLAKGINVTFVDDVVGKTEKKYFGKLLYCYKEGYDIRAVEMAVDNCVQGNPMKPEEKVKGYQKKDQKLYDDQSKNELYLESDILKSYRFEILFGATLGLIYLIFSIVFEAGSIVFVEMKWKKYFTLVKRTQIPKPRNYKSDDDSVPFIVKTANVDKFGRMTMTRGCLVCPKFLEDEIVLKRYQLNIGINKQLPQLKDRSGFWNVLAASARHEKEKVLYHFKVSLSKLLYSPRGCRTMLSIPIAMIVIILILIGILLAFVYFQGSAVMGLSAICVICSIIGLYVIGAIFEFLGGILQLLSEQVIVTDSRLVFMWIERFNYKIEYLYFNDIDEIKLKENSNLINCGISAELIERFRVLTLRSRGDDEIMQDSNTIFNYLSFLTKEEAASLVEFIKEQKEKYKDFKVVDNQSDEEMEAQEDVEMVDNSIKITLGLEDEKDEAKYEKLDDDEEIVEDLAKETKIEIKEEKME